MCAPARSWPRYFGTVERDAHAFPQEFHSSQQKDVLATVGSWSPTQAMPPQPGGADKMDLEHWLNRPSEDPYRYPGVSRCL